MAAATDSPEDDDDLTEQSVLSETVICNQLHERYQKHKYYTFISDVLVFVNPSQPLLIYNDEFHNLFKSEPIPKKPHIFWTASQAYNELNQSKKNQCIVLCGESGSGKTENAKLLIRHLVHVSSERRTNIHERLVHTNQLIEAFGNARTSLNNNSSRFGKFFSIKYDSQGRIGSAKIHQFLLENSRVISGMHAEHNFHIFYQLLNGLSGYQMQSFGLYGYENYRVLKMGDPMDCCDENFNNKLDELSGLMKILGFSQQDIFFILSVLVCIVHITEIRFTVETDDTNKRNLTGIENNFSFDYVCNLLDLDSKGIEDALIYRSISKKGFTARSKKTLASACAERDTFAASLYSNLFDWIVNTINAQLGNNNSKEDMCEISIIDTPGFEMMPTNGYEQLCKNTSNEIIERYANEALFMQEETDYEDDILYTPIDPQQDVKDILFQDPSMFIVIDNETSSTKSSAATLKQALDRTFGESPRYSSNDNEKFSLHHHTGKVEYHVDGMLESNRNHVNPELVKCLANSKNKHVRKLQASGKSPGQSGTADHTENYTSKQLRRSLSDLMTKMSDTKPWLVRCIKANDNQAPATLQQNVVGRQIKSAGLLEVAQQRKSGYALRLTPSEFLQRYRDISFERKEDIQATFDNCEKILLDAKITGYTFGKQKIFLRHWHGQILQGLAFEARTTMTTDDPVEDCTRSQDVLGAEGYTQISNCDTSDGTSTIKPLPRTNSSTSNCSQQRVTEWMRQNENMSDKTFDSATPPPLLPKPQRDQHVRISIPEYYERKVLDERLWDRFQMIPRERISTSDTIRPFVKAFKFFCYFLLFCIVLTSAVVSKMCILLLTSSIIKDPVSKVDANSPAFTMLVIAICFPYVCWVISYSAKSLFGSSAWPSFKMILITLFLELLHTFGLSLLVFHILPQMDMARGVLVLCGVSTVPTLLKSLSVSCDISMPIVKRCTLGFINCIAFLIQLANLPGLTLFGAPLTDTEKNQLKSMALNRPNVHLHVVYRKEPTFENRIMWEIPVALFFISISYWENFVCGNLRIGSLSIPLLDWKRQKHSVRQRLFIFAGVWKIGWTMVFAILLLPGFSFNMSFSTSSVIKDVQKDNTVSPTPSPIRNVQEDLVTVYPSTLLVENENTTVFPLSATTVNVPTIPGYEGSGRNLRVRRTIADDINSRGIDAVLNLSSATLQQHQNSVFGVMSPIEDTSNDSTETSTKEISTNNNSQVFHPVFPITIPKYLEKNFQQYGPLYLHLIASTLMSYFGGLACKLCMQTFGFTIPLFLATPVTFGIVIAQSYTQFIHSHTYAWICPEKEGNVRLFHLIWLGVLWCSQIIVTAHIWFPKNGRMAKIDRLFVLPMRCGVLLDHGMMLRRRANDRDFALFNTEDDDSFIFDDEEEVHKADDVVPQIYACATMWHETRSEMTQLLKSLFRMDIDHSARYLAQKFYDIKDPDYYEFEAHIFFDDAMELSDDDLLVPNSFVADLIDCIEDALSSVHERQMYIAPPVRMPTPYGGRLIWRLPGGTNLVVHLKDKHKVRHKKRWSQVMYMYYLLGYRILAQPDKLMRRGTERKDSHACDDARVKLTETQLRRRRQASHFTRSVIFNYTSEEVHTQAENTFILSLDGDVDFKPDAVRLLVDRLKKNKKVGAACGRIHPIGSGPILWYQEFEYAIGHWLQKATEHVFGCVLCAPGCFSLFRGSAIMDDNVARSYAIRTTEAGQYVQYDQGEDRWLSTLLLQQGYRIDYCAASDALTHAPETFSEFFNQRRRWGPSTLANICDLLGDWKNTVRLNDNISTPYIFYQFLLLVSTVLGPATVLLMMAGAFTVVFKTTIVESYAISLVPAIIFIIICISTKPQTQITVATIMSACYAIIMTIVLVGTVGTGIEGGLTSPNVIFLLLLVFIFFLSALFHPEEFACLIPGALYFICIPTGYLVLTIYYLCNLHIVSWGTREVPQRKTREEIEAERLAEEEKKRKKEGKKGFLGWLGLDKVMNETVEMFQQLRRAANQENGGRKQKTDDLLEELILELRQGRENKGYPPKQKQSPMMADTERPPSQPEQQIIPSVPPRLQLRRNDSCPVWLRNEDPENPGWLTSLVCGEGPIKRMSERERIFWRQLIKKYLFPINEDKLHQEKVAADLKNLRNNVVFGFFMTSALWIALTMQLQLLQDEFKDTILFIKIPNFDPSRKDLTFEPLGMLFLVLFATILFFQFIGMLSHRWGTILHVLSITDISCTQQFTEKHKIQEIITKTMELQRVINIENEPEPDYGDGFSDYDGEEFEDEDDISSSLFTDSTVSSLSVSRPPPSYHSQEITDGKKCIKRHNSAVFNRRGFVTGRTLRRAFERRYRNEKNRGNLESEEVEVISNLSV